jgi:hypothetical protein
MEMQKLIPKLTFFDRHFLKLYFLIAQKKRISYTRYPKLENNTYAFVKKWHFFKSENKRLNPLIKKKRANNFPLLFRENKSFFAYKRQLLSGFG